MTRSNKSNTQVSHRIIQFSTIERTAHVRILGQYRHPVRHLSIAAINPRLQVQRAVMSAIIAVVTLFYPAAGLVMAQEPEATTTPTETTSTETPPAETPPAPAPETTTPAPAPAPEPEKKSGSESEYFQNADGNWENDKYIVDANTGKVIVFKNQVQLAPAPAPTQNAPATLADNSLATEEQRVPVPVPPATLDLDGDTSSYDFNLGQSVQLTNNLDSQAHTGDASVMNNNLAEHALSGNALTMATVMNMLQSSTSFGGNDIATFNTDINGNVTGDLFIDPSLLASLQSSNTGNNGLVDVNGDINGRIDNNLTLNATTGDATVEHNNTAGNATSGNAHAVANLVNLMNSAIGSGKSFVGAMNIYGNLNGDILLPPGFLNSLLASNGSETNLNSSNIENSNLLAEFTDNQSINNNINSTAATGNATVERNNDAGSATTGNALNNVTVLNLTGRQVVADNSILVFVNVLGKWVGLIMDAPAGSTSAALGGGVSQNNFTGNTTNMTANSTMEINNNLDINARSGDATVRENNNAGSAKSGDATTSVNIANILNSSLNLSNWFGVLFINVFGTWNGSFGLDTEAGGWQNQPGQPAAPSGGGGGGGSVASSQDVRVFQFRPTGSGTHRLEPVATEEAPEENSNPQVQSAKTMVGDDDDAAGGATTSVDANWLIPLLGFAAGTSVLGGERYVSSRQRRKNVL